MTDLPIPPEAIEAAARAMAKAGYGFAGIELTDPYTADADYWDHTARAACRAMLKAWPDSYRITLDYTNGPTPMVVLPLPQESTN